MRKAARIDLHDADTVLATINGDWAGWCDDNELHAYETTGGAIYEFFHRLLRHPNDYIDSRVKHFDYKLLTKVVSYAGEAGEEADYEITELMAEPQGINQLRIELTRVYCRGHPSDEFSETAEITYSGNYTIWWEKEQS